MSKEKQAMVLRAYVLYFGFVAVLLIGLYKTFALQQVVSDAELPVRTVDKIPRKGEILDANLVPLVTSVAYFDIYMDPSVVDKEVFDAQVSDLAQGLIAYSLTKRPGVLKMKFGRRMQKNPGIS